MKDLFWEILNRSVTASWVILAVLLVRLLLRRAPRKYSYYLWSVVGFRLLCSYSFPARFSLFRLKPLQPSGEFWNRGVTKIKYLPEFYEYTIPQVETGKAPLQSPPAVDWGIVLAWVWFAGVAALLLYGLVTYLLLKRRVCTAIPVTEEVYQADGIRSPFILGLFRPVVYIPYHLDAEARRYILLHEQCHLQRRDYLTRPLSYVLLAIHWFNPLCWLAFWLSGRDMELSCDEAVLAQPDCSRKAYSTTLLNVARERQILSPTPLAFGEVAVKDRILNALRWYDPSPWAAVVSIGILAAVLVFCGLNPKDEDSMSGTIVEVEFEAETHAPIMTVKSDSGRKRTVMLGKTGAGISHIEEIDGAEYFEGPRVGDTVRANYRYGKRKVTTAGGETLRVYDAAYISLLEALLDETAVLSDGTRLRIRQDDWRKIYLLEDGTVLLQVENWIGPESTWVMDQPNFEDLPQAVQEAVSAYYAPWSEIDEAAFLELAYEQYQRRPEDFGRDQCSVQYAAGPSGQSDRLAYFTLQFVWYPAHGYRDLRQTVTAFDRITGEVVPTEAWLTVPPVDFLEAVLASNQMEEDPVLEQEIRAAFRPEYIELDQTWVSIQFPRGTLPSQETDYFLMADYTPELLALIQPWALPKDLT